MFDTRTTWQHHGRVVCKSLFLLLVSLPCFAEKIPDTIHALLAKHCHECHSKETFEGDVSLELKDTNWNSANATRLWEKVYNALRQEEMPPAGAKQPLSSDRSHMVNWLQRQLSKHVRLGGGVPRRLNRREYENTIRVLFDFPEFSVSDSFPADDSSHGFDNVGEGLILSPPLMAEYLSLATKVADEILPPDTGPEKPNTKQYSITPIDLTNYRDAGVTKIGEQFRMVSSKNMANSAAWPNRFEATQSGVYRLTMNAQVFQTNEMFYQKRSNPFRLSIYARPKTEQVYAPMNELRKLASLLLSTDNANQLSCEIELNKGEVFGVRWEDGPCVSDVPSREYAKEFFDERLQKNRRHYAAMLKLGAGTRGMTQEEFYLTTRSIMDSDELDLTDLRLDTLPKEYGGGLSDRPFRWIKNYVHEEMFRIGPAVDISVIKIEGPLKLIEDDESRTRVARSQRFLGKHAATQTDRDFATQVLSSFLSRAFRRPVSQTQLDTFVAYVASLQYNDPKMRVQDALHQAVRRTLVSPHFLYRGLKPGRLDDFALASRLSYFLTMSPPDQQLLECASRGDLADPDVLEQETLRLLDDPRCDEFVRSFTGQWLGTRKLEDIMPDPRLLKFYAPDRKAMIDETEMFFAEMLRENHAVKHFIDPGFSYRNANLNKIYGGELEGTQMRRVVFEQGGRDGGLLSLGSVMMATANGVDTHPVHRGVWLLENILGSPTPNPPDDIPAIAPNTSGTTTIRDQLSAHRAEKSCASCHNKIDPLGLVLENFDPVGRWREHYPIYAKPADGTEKLQKEFYSTVGSGTKTGPPIDPSAVMPDGTELVNVVNLKRYVLENIDPFSKCLTEKLMVYATGRPLGFGDRLAAANIVERMGSGDKGMRDLIVAIILSEPFHVQ